MTDVDISITKRVQTTIPEARPYEPPYSAVRLVTEVNVLWSLEGDVWLPATVKFTSSIPKQDGTPSARFTENHVFTDRKKAEFFASFPEASTPPTETVNVTINGSAA